MTSSDFPLYRLEELSHILQRIASTQCISIVGVSNIGKSALLRSLQRLDVRQKIDPGFDNKVHFFYIDCNRMVEQSEHAFYELILREMISSLAEETSLIQTLSQEYHTLLNPPNDLFIPLSFNQALTTLLETHKQRLVFIFDEFDAAYQTLDGRVFLNLRAMKDRYGSALTYVVATDQRLSFIRSGEHVDEFKELFGLNILYIHPLPEHDARRLIQECSQAVAAHFDENDVRFVLSQAGGHPALLDIVCRRLAEVTGEARRSDSEDWLIHREVRDMLRNDLAVSAECDKIWQDLSLAEQNALDSFFLADVSNDSQAVAELMRRGILGEKDDELHFFADIFEEYVRRRNIAQYGPDKGVRVDAEAGEVYVNGRRTETLTNLEFRLLLLLYGQLNKICDKYSIVEAVWGEDYVDEVYDSAIEKLVSRVRRKVEPNPASPKYIITVRGRGYKLVG